ncbi:hypothetical protein [Methylomonas albis]|uniref:Uncharacterized protein n=1 Tax=Methylomonas albis TaxID=1854563 RepID=A0ABR9D472_9GAMM|nr:hypothetical protein [Methylomonas albis]MBD9357919.1 hypothetical protein [Methylomonas albis]CAD6881257.1 hypothetical protein [Methylomonas albis]
MGILLIGAAACITGLILSAWLMTLARWFPINGVDQMIVDFKTMIRAHVDYALMALFNLGFYGLGMELPLVACWCVAIGGFTNPTVFTIAAFDADFWKKSHWRLYTAASFIMTTIGFMWLAIVLLKRAL